MPPYVPPHACRVGRTGRFGTLGISVSYVTPTELESLRAYLQEAQAGKATHGFTYLHTHLHTYIPRMGVLMVECCSSLPSYTYTTVKA